MNKYGNVGPWDDILVLAGPYEGEENLFLGEFWSL